MHAVAVLNPKGGSGKTTISINLARALQKAGLRVLIVDTDPQGTARDWWDTAQEQHPDAEMPLVIGLDRPNVSSGIQEIGRDYDVVVIDGAAKLQETTASTLKVADTVLIVVQPSAGDLWSALDLAELIRARREAVGKPQAAFLINRQIKGSRLANDILPALEEEQLPVFKSRTSSLVSYADSLGAGLTVLDRTAYRQAGQEILAIRDEFLAFADLRARVREVMP